MKRGNPTSPRSTEARKLEIYQYWIPKPKLTSRASGLTWKATFLILSQYHPTNLPKKLRNWSDTLEQYTVTDSNQPSWLKPRPLSPTQRYLPSLIQALVTPKKMQRWLPLRKITSMKKSTKSWWIRMSTKHTCKRSTISLWSKQMNNY